MKEKKSENRDKIRKDEHALTLPPGHVISEKALSRPSSKTPEELEESPIEVFSPPHSNLDEEISQSMHLINSSTSELHSQMKKITSCQSPLDGDPHTENHKAHALSSAGRGIADLLRVKVDLMKMQRTRLRIEGKK